MGGLISGYMAKLAGERVDCLVLVGAVGTTARRGTMAPMKSWRRLPTDDEKRAAHRTNLGILMVHDPDAIGDDAVYMQHHNAERSRVRGKHINPTGDLSMTLPGFKGRLASIWGEHDATAGPYLAERKEKLEQFKPGVELRRHSRRRALGAVRGARRLQPAAARAVERRLQAPVA